MKLLLTQKNDIFDIIIDENLNPNDFIFSEKLGTMNDTTAYLYYKDKKYYFIFCLLGIHGYQIEYSPGEKSLETFVSVHGDWKQFLTKVKRWLKNLKREVNTIDKWNNFKKEVQLVPFLFESFDNYAEKEMFSEKELKVIELIKDNIENEIKNLGLSKEVIKQFSEKLDNLNKKAEKLSKTDWKELFIGAIIGLLLNLALPPETSETIWDIIRNAFKMYILP